jgi:hypothetical protein
MKKNLIPFYILWKSVYAFKNILEKKREGWEIIPIIVNILFTALYLLFLDKLLFIEPSMDIIANFNHFCQWYLTVYLLGVIILGFWILEPLFLKTRIDRLTIVNGLLIGTFMLPISKII